MSKSNQEIEEYYFERFRQHYNLPEGSIDYGDKPDVISAGNRTIGIEITNLYHTAGDRLESEQNQHKLREKVVSRARETYLSRGGNDFEFSFSFDKRVPIQAIKPLAAKIADLGRRMDFRPTGPIDRSLFAHIPELEFAYLNATRYEQPKWRCIQSHKGQVLSKERLLEVVGAKEAQARSYRRCDEYWLLAVVDFMNPAQDQEIQIEGLEKLESSIFERILVYRTLIGHVLEAK